MDKVVIKNCLLASVLLQFVGKYIKLPAHCKMINEKYRQIIQITRDLGVLRTKDLNKYKIPRNYLQRMVDDGLLTRVSRGLYTLPDANITEHHTLAVAARRVPHGIICLLSALQFHSLTTQLPHQIWMGIDPKSRLPQVADIQLRFVRFSGTALTKGLTIHEIEKVPVPITVPAKTVADCFKYRNKIGVDVAIEALRECITAKNASGQPLCSIDDIWHYAEICRVTNVMLPYLETLT